MAVAPTSMAEALTKILSDCAAAMTTPDADVDFLSKLQGVIVGRLRQGSQQSPAGGQQMGGQSPSGMGNVMGGALGGQGAGAPPMTGGPGMMSGMPSSAGVNGVSSLAPQPNPDELRRMIAQTAGAG